jgi:hypothetical protein
MMRLNLLRTDLAVARLAVEYALPESFVYKGVTFENFAIDGDGGNFNDYEIKAAFGALVEGKTKGYGALNWKATGFTLTGPTSQISSGNKIALNGPCAKSDFTIIASSTDLKYPLFRLRRAYNTPVAAEIIGIGNGVLKTFAVALAHAPVCPLSLHITFTDAGGLKTARIVDTGKGILASTAPDILLDPQKLSYIDYLTGKGELNFVTGHVPTAVNMTAKYEYASDGKEDQASYAVIWELEE